MNAAGQTAGARSCRRPRRPRCPPARRRRRRRPARRRCDRRGGRPHHRPPAAVGRPPAAPPVVEMEGEGVEAGGERPRARPQQRGGKGAHVDAQHQGAQGAQGGQVREQPRRGAPAGQRQVHNVGRGPRGDGERRPVGRVKRHPPPQGEGGGQAGAAEEGVDEPVERPHRRLVGPPVVGRPALWRRPVPAAAVDGQAVQRPAGEERREPPDGRAPPRPVHPHRHPLEAPPRPTTGP